MNVVNARSGRLFPNAEGLRNEGVNELGSRARVAIIFTSPCFVHNSLKTRQQPRPSIAGSSAVGTRRLWTKHGEVNMIATLA